MEVLVYSNNYNHPHDGPISLGKGIYFPSRKELLLIHGKDDDIWTRVSDDKGMRKEADTILKFMKKKKTTECEDKYLFSGLTYVKKAKLIQLSNQKANSLLRKMKDREMLEKKLRPELSDILSPLNMER